MFFPSDQDLQLQTVAVDFIDRRVKAGSDSNQNQWSKWNQVTGYSGFKRYLVFKGLGRIQLICLLKE